LKPNKRSKRKSQKRMVIAAVIAIMILAGGAWWVLRPGADVGEGSLAANRPYTLSPAQFSHDPKAQAAYQVAKDIPEVLEQLPCFCGCMMNRGHKNNLFCFSDEHGSACDICEDIALDARDMHKQGWSIQKIKDAIIERYSHSH
jgi:hypothetical protein